MSSQNPTIRKLPYLPSKEWSQKVTRENIPNDSKSILMASTANWSQQKNQVKQVKDFMQTPLTEYEKQFQCQFNTKMAQMEMQIIFQSILLN